MKNVTNNKVKTNPFFVLLLLVVLPLMIYRAHGSTQAYSALLTTSAPWAV